MRALLVVLVVSASGCGVKAPPKPPLDRAAPADADAGCCGGSVK